MYVDQVLGIVISIRSSWCFGRKSPDIAHFANFGTQQDRHGVGSLPVTNLNLNRLLEMTVSTFVSTIHIIGLLAPGRLDRRGN